MGYELIGENDILNPREQILKNRGITEELLNVGEEAVEDYEPCFSQGIRGYPKNYCGGSPARDNQEQVSCSIRNRRNAGYPSGLVP